MKAKSLPPFIGIRIKPFTEDLKERGARTLDIFLTTLASKTGGKLPNNFVVMLPKVSIPEQITALVQLFEAIEGNTKIAKGALKMEMMVETTQAVIGSDGSNPLRRFVLASKGRMIATAFGTYDYTAANNITAKYQDMGHAVCDFAHMMMKVSLGATGIWLSDGATNVMPIGPHRGANSHRSSARRTRPWYTATGRRRTTTRATRSGKASTRAGTSTPRNSPCATPPSTASSWRATTMPPRASKPSWNAPPAPRSPAMSSTMPRPVRACSTTSCAASTAAPSASRRRWPQGCRWRRSGRARS
jgi:hypothetical protein